MNPYNSANSPYYLEIADYSGVVASARLETQGLIGSVYADQYLKECYYHFYRAAAPHSRSWKFKSPLESRAGIMLLYRRWGRLYIYRKLNPLKKHLLDTILYEGQALSNINSNYQHNAADKALALATRLREVASRICADTTILRKVRLGRVPDFKPYFASDPRNSRDENESQTGKRIALIANFHGLLEQFDTSVLGKNHTAVEQAVYNPWTSLLIGALSLPDLFSFFADCGLLTAAGELTPLGRGDGITKAKKAPWAGTLEALIKSHLLDPTAAVICRVLSDPAGGIGIKMNEGTLRDTSRKAGIYRELANEQLQKRGLLRK